MDNISVYDKEFVSIHGEWEFNHIISLIFIKIGYKIK